MRIIYGWTQDEINDLKQRVNNNQSSVNIVSNLFRDNLKTDNTPLGKKFSRLSHEDSDYFVKDIADYCTLNAEFEEPKHIYYLKDVVAEDRHKIYVLGFENEKIIVTLDANQAASFTKTKFIKCLDKTAHYRDEFIGGYQK